MARRALRKQNRRNVLTEGRRRGAASPMAAASNGIANRAGISGPAYAGLPASVLRN